MARRDVGVGVSAFPSSLPAPYLMPSGRRCGAHRRVPVEGGRIIAAGIGAHAWSADDGTGDKIVREWVGAPIARVDARAGHVCECGRCCFPRKEDVAETNR